MSCLLAKTRMALLRMSGSFAMDCEGAASVSRQVFLGELPRSRKWKGAALSLGENRPSRPDCARLEFHVCLPYSFTIQ